MFRTAELGRKISAKEFEEIAPRLRIDMVELQQKLRNAGFPVILVFAGVDGAGKGESINLLNSWMDPRWIETHAYRGHSDEERERPRFWRYWRDLPPAGRMGVFLGSWYSSPVLDHAYGRISDAELDERLARIKAFEKMLADDGALILKFWMHLGKAAQKTRLKKLEKDPTESWRVTSLDWQHWEMYEQFITAAERTIRMTSSGHAPWSIVEGVDERYRSLTVLTSLRDAGLRHIETMSLRRQVAASMAMNASLRSADGEVVSAAASLAEPGDMAEGLPKAAEMPLQPTVLQALDMSLAVGKEEFERHEKESHARLHRLQFAAKEAGLTSLLVFEGWDAAGKGGAIRHVTAALDARDYQVLPFAAPTDEEKSHHYLWRFWRHLPRAGRVTLFDRSWYGRVLVERIEGFASTEEWMRAYAEINEFEEQLVDFGMVLCKFWLHVTPEEQLRRFERRQNLPWKRWKLTEEDWRNREKWGQYEQAVNDMIERTSTRRAPWTLVEANCKRFTRVKVIDTFCDRLETALKAKGVKLLAQKPPKH